MPLVVVSGPLANKPFNGGAAWTRLSWILGFRELGWNVFFLEQIASEECSDATGAPASFDNSANLAFFRDVMQRSGLKGTAALICDDGARIWGAEYHELVELARSADLLINISGHLRHEELLGQFTRKLYLDLDPGFTQLWWASGTGDLGFECHDMFFTVGENIGRPDCSIPTDGIAWRPIRQPVVLEHWPVSPLGRADRFTTVGSWRGPYGPVEYQGTTLGPKVHEFRKFSELPRLAAGNFELALEIHTGDSKDLELLRQHGWTVVDPKVVAGTPELFRRYVQSSGAEWSVAQGMYVHTHSGWFSDRTVRYLASGKPALVQDTGFSQRYPTGMGLVAFSSLEEAVDGAERIVREYADHSRAARRLAEEHFAAPNVLGDLLSQIEASR